MEPGASPCQFRCFISSCGIISAEALLSSHCAENLVLCQTVGQGALNQNIYQRRREITGIALCDTCVHTSVYYFVIVKSVNLISFRHFISAAPFFFNLYMICPVSVLACIFLLYCNPVRWTWTPPSNWNNNNIALRPALSTTRTHDHDGFEPCARLVIANRWATPPNMAAVQERPRCIWMCQAALSRSSQAGS